MKNLFVLHTQYNIILGAAIVSQYYNNVHNDLIVYSEFQITDEYKHNIEKIFNNVIYLRESFEKMPNSILKQQILFIHEYRSFRKSQCAQQIYDNIFLSQDRELDSLIYGYYKKRNPLCNCYDIEEDCYYSIDSKKNDIGYSTPKRKNLIHKFRKLLWGKQYRFETDKFFYGASSFFDGYFVLYPDFLRPQLLGKCAQEVKTDAIIKAINNIYVNHLDYIPIADKYYLFFFDLLERYQNVQSILDILKNIYDKSIEEGATLLVKYHPRETNKVHFGEQLVEIPSLIPAEKVLSDLAGRNVTVLGNATTSILVANKFLFKTISIAKIDGNLNLTMLMQLEHMGIHVINSIDEI